MCKSLRNKIYKSVAGLGIVGLLYMTSPNTAGAEGLENIQPAFNIKGQSATLRLEGGGTLADRLKYYALTDLDASSKKPFDFESFYLESRLIYFILEKFGVLAEYNGGTGLKDFVRFGLVYTPNFGKGNFASFRLLPVETNGQAGPQLGGFVSQEFLERLGASVLAEYNLNPNAVYFELEFAGKLTDTLSLFVQGRGFTPVDKMPDITPVVGVRYQK